MESKNTFFKKEGKKKWGDYDSEEEKEEKKTRSNDDYAEEKTSKKQNRVQIKESYIIMDKSV